MRNSLTLAFAVLLGARIATQVVAQTNPPYIAEMPSVDQVMKAMQTNDPDDSAAGPVTVNGIFSEGVHDGIDYTTGKQATIYQYRRVTRNCPRPILSSKGTGPGVVGMEKNMLVGMFNGGDTGPPTPPGLRMNGTYAAGSGFSVGFFPESAIVGCGPDVARAYPYKVIADGKQAVVKIEASDHPLTLEMNANNTLDPGSGQYVVQGRRIT